MRFFSSALALICLNAAIVFGQVTSSALSPAAHNNCQCSTLSWTQTVDDLFTDGILLVNITTAINATSIVSVQYAGYNLSLVASQSINGHGKNFVYYLLAPVSGTNTVTVTIDRSDDIAAASTVFYGVNQLSPFEGGTAAAIKSQGSSSTVSANGINSATLGDWALQFVGALKQTNSIGLGQNWNVYENHNSAIYELITDEVRTAATMTLTTGLSGGGGDWGSIGIALKPGSALPIQLLSFTVEAGKNKVDVKWSSASETNNKFYTIERSNDGIHFESYAQIDSKAPKGNSLKQLDYSFADRKPIAGTSYYRLRQTDYNGKNETFKMASVNVISNSDITFTVYPNPNAGEFKVNFSGLENNHEVVLALFDTEGKEVYSNVFYLQETAGAIDIVPKVKLSKGMYQCALIMEGISYYVKVMVN